MYFRFYFNIVFAGSCAPFAALYLLLDGDGELILGDGGDDPLQPLHEAPSGQGLVPQLRFHFWEDKISARTRSSKKGG